jgi:hypothetical protein
MDTNDKVSGMHTYIVKYIILLMVLLMSLSVFLCNPTYEDVPGSSWNSIHSVRVGGFYHGANYRFPFGNCDESKCHGTDLTGGNSGAVSCYTCHGDTWSFFQTHNKNKDGAYHHYNVERDPDVYCTPCHGAALDGGTNGEPSCYSCHSSIPDD